MARSHTDSLWRFWFAALTAAATLGLIGLGGLVTSHGVGMAVPDWPTTYGYNLFFFPLDQWVGGVFYEHTHRLYASGIGLLTTVLAIWLIGWDARPAVRWLGGTALGLVIVQGVLGGLRVRLMLDELGIFHAALAQLFLFLLAALALGQSRWWRHGTGEGARSRVHRGLPWVLWGFFALLFLQLMLGATMRHQHAGLAVPDFPLAYGRIWPAMDPAALETINQNRVDARDYGPVTAFQISLHMAHRVTALVILVAAWVLAWRMGRWTESPILKRSAWAMAGLVGIQALLGAATVWSNKAADVATLHVVLGAASLVGVGLMGIVSVKFSVDAGREVLHSPRAQVPGPGHSGGPVAATYRSS